jgi:hypothetical protein
VFPCTVSPGYFCLLSGRYPEIVMYVSEEESCVISLFAAMSDDMVGKCIFSPANMCSLLTASTDRFDCCWKHWTSQWGSSETDRREWDWWAIPSKIDIHSLTAPGSEAIFNGITCKHENICTLTCTQTVWVFLCIQDGSIFCALSKTTDMVEKSFLWPWFFNTREMCCSSSGEQL